MFDARLNSVHLEAPRRHEFRTAREKLLGARGGETLAAERRSDLDQSDNGNTAICNVSGQDAATDARYVLMDAEYIYPLKPGLNTVGRMPDNDVVVPDAYVSRRHCAVLVHATDGCELHDIASKNGTLLNGRKITGPTPLQSGDEIRMCNRNLIFLRKNEVPQRGRPAQATRVE
jgi:hypothetical protein